MSEARLYLDYLQDMLDALNDIRNFTDGLSQADFLTDRKTSNAVIRSLEVLGEAAGKIPLPLRVANPDIPWADMAGMRNKLIHEYFGVDLEIVWQTLIDDLPPLRAGITDLVSRESSGTPP